MRETCTLGQIWDPGQAPSPFLTSEFGLKMRTLIARASRTWLNRLPDTAKLRIFCPSCLSVL